MDDETIQAMQGIADAGARCVEQSGSSSPARLRSEYHRLRDDAAALNERFGWTSEEEFTSMFPSPTPQGEVDALTVQVWGSDTICLLLMFGVRERPSEALDKLVREVFVGE